MMLGSGWNSLTPVIKNLLIINGLMLLATLSFSLSIGIDLRAIFGLHYPGSQDFEIYQLVSYIFMHGGFEHFFWNMFAIWLFGSAIERTWGSRRFLTFYVLTGLGAAFLHYLIFYIEAAPDLAAMEAIIVSPEANAILDFYRSHFWVVHPIQYPEMTNQLNVFQVEVLNVLLNDPTNVMALSESQAFMNTYLEHYKNAQLVVGASGSLFGILIAFGMMFGNQSIRLLFFPIPIKIWWIVSAYGISEVFAAFQDNPGDNVAHFAHIGGMLFGFLIIKFWQLNGQRWR